MDVCRMCLPGIIKPSRDTAYLEPDMLLRPCLQATHTVDWPRTAPCRPPRRCTSRPGFASHTPRSTLPTAPPLSGPVAASAAQAPTRVNGYMDKPLSLCDGSNAHLRGIWDGAEGGIPPARCKRRHRRIEDLQRTDVLEPKKHGSRVCHIIGHHQRRGLAGRMDRGEVRSGASTDRDWRRNRYMGVLYLIGRVDRDGQVVGVGQRPCVQNVPLCMNMYAPL